MACHNSVLSSQIFCVPGNFLTGHIAHLNLRDDLLLYKNVIAEVILDVSISACLRLLYLCIFSSLYLVVTFLSTSTVESVASL